MDLELTAGRSRLAIRTINERGWSEVWLKTEEGERRLGAEGHRYVARHLINTLSGEEAARTNGEIDGVKVSWVLALAEDHHVLYAADAGDSLVVFVEDARQSPARLVGRMELSKEERERWANQLAELQDWQP